jgi:hypothetical protein
MLDKSRTAKVYVIEWFHETQREWFPLEADTNFARAHRKKREIMDRNGSKDKFRVVRYFRDRGGE